ncbi:MAG: hypothetical protein DAHOPDDO_00826 [Ignavibacteriaceae bacterium]|nr:hypothetical protein [Ignavibacteriaceae bacterium]
MILNNSQNRKIIFEYLNKVSEDDFIDEIIIPLFSSRGYEFYRRNSHGPGEKGKDLIFCRYIDLHYDLEYIAVQAKAEPITASNVSEIAQQLIRAYKTSIPIKSGSGKIKPNYAILINARKHTNDASSELPDLVDNNQNIKIIQQENICDLIIKSGIAPNSLINELSLESQRIVNNKYDEQVFNIILENKPKEIEELFEHKLRFLRDKISDDTKNLIVDYLFYLWQQDSSWEGIVKPLKWLSEYFDLILEDKYRLLTRVLVEFTDTTPSFKAQPYTRRIIQQMKIDHFKAIADDLVFRISLLIYQPRGIELTTLVNKLAELVRSKQLEDELLLRKAKLLIDAYNAMYCNNMDNFKNYMDEYQKLIWI